MSSVGLQNSNRESLGVNDLVEPQRSLPGQRGAITADEDACPGQRKPVGLQLMRQIDPLCQFGPRPRVEKVLHPGTSDSLARGLITRQNTGLRSGQR